MAKVVKAQGSVTSPEREEVMKITDSALPCSSGTVRPGRLARWRSAERGAWA